MLIDLPTVSYLPSLKTSARLNELYLDEALKCVIYMLGPDVKEEEQSVLRAFIGRFREEVLQYVTAADMPLVPPATSDVDVIDAADGCNGRIAERYHFRKSAVMHQRLHLLDPAIFPPLPALNRARKRMPMPPLQPMLPGWTLNMAPELCQVQTSFEPAVLRPPSERYLREIRHWQRQIASACDANTDTDEDVCVITLGTGAMMASRSRNGKSCFYLRLLKERWAVDAPLHLSELYDATFQEWRCVPLGLR